MRKKQQMLAFAASLATAGFLFDARPARARQAADPQVQAAREAERAADQAEKRADRAERQADRAERQTDRAVERAEERAEDRREAAKDARDAASAQAAAMKLPAGIQPKEADDIADVRKTLNAITEAALTKDGFDDFVERLVDQDRNRIGANDFAEKTFADLNAKAEQFRQAWKAKYGKEFEINPEDAFAMTKVIQGEIQEPAALAGNWPLKATMAGQASGAGEAVAAGERATRATQDPETGRPTPRPGGPNEGTERLAANEDANLTKGREVAVATFPASHGLPTLHVSLVGEAQGWRVDAPNTVTGQQLHDRLLKHLTHVTDMSAQWPADVKQAQMAVAHHVLAAVYGVEMKPQQQQQQQQQGGGSQRQ